jgi:hypothetical protein
MEVEETELPIVSESGDEDMHPKLSLLHFSRAIVPLDSEFCSGTS